MGRENSVRRARTQLAAREASSEGNRELPSFLAPKSPPRSGNDNDHPIVDEGAANELDCLRSTLPPGLLRAAESRARSLGIGVDQVLIKSGVIDETTYSQRLARHLGIARETFVDMRRGDTVVPVTTVPLAVQSGLLSVSYGDELTYVVAPQRFNARLLCRFAAGHPHLTHRLRVTTTADLRNFLRDCSATTLEENAAFGLANRFPDLSAAPPRSPATGWRIFKRVALGGGLAALTGTLAVVASPASSSLAAALFITFAGLRLAGALVPRQPIPLQHRLPDDRLPTYTVIAALYREAASVPSLIEAINALDYPREKLDVILVVEADDPQTRAAIERLGHMPHVQMLIAPATGPKTKPKALNCALPFVRGSFLAVFDAEDCPEPGQLHAALGAFRAHGGDVACVQASLCIHNSPDSWLTRMFAAEYAGQFDIFLPGLTALGLPLPLGGSSNHFRTAVLRDVGGWDAYNVTEDADLGFRLARFGYRAATFASTTYEEAPIRFGAWLRQRSRWMKGWMQTWLVHMRSPRRMWRDSGPQGFFALNVIVGGNVMTALACPILLGSLIVFVWRGEFGGHMLHLHIAAIAAGLLSTVTIGLMGLARRRQLRGSWILAWTPVYWTCLAIAAWRALLQLCWDPYRWEKTEHGLTQHRSH